MLQNASVTAFTASELLRENQQGGVKLPPPPLLRIGLNYRWIKQGNQLIYLISTNFPCVVTEH